MNYTHKDQFGRNARVIAQDVAGKLNVALAVQIAEHEEQVILAATGIGSKDSYLTPWATTNPALYFKPYNLWEEVEIDTPVWCKDKDSRNWSTRHFAGMLDGKPSVWINGRTSHSASIISDNRRVYDLIQLENPNGN